MAGAALTFQLALGHARYRALPQLRIALKTAVMQRKEVRVA
ncbi:MAG: hypothetical protein RDU83_00180 [bacterium]|nr:hypothetical protein [bacterium]